MPVKRHALIEDIPLLPVILGGRGREVPYLYIYIYMYVYKP
jgi:hypothetical protein